MSNAIIFDKDGTLLDFGGTWDEAVGLAFDAIQDVVLRKEVAELFGYDLEYRYVLPTSAFVSESGDTCDQILSELIDVAAFKCIVNEASRQNIRSNANATETLRLLKERGWELAVATNDSEEVARSHIKALSWTPFFSSVKGFDSGFGAKPGPGMVLAAAEECNALNETYLMVGDSLHDILAGSAAGAVTVAIGKDDGAAALADFRIDNLSELISLADQLG